MWEHGSMGWHHGWHYGQAHEMMEMMREHSMRGWDGPEIDNPLAAFVNSFAEKMGEKAADAVTGGHDD